MTYRSKAKKPKPKRGKRAREPAERPIWLAPMSMEEAIKIIAPSELKKKKGA